MPQTRAGLFLLPLPPLSSFLHCRCVASPSSHWVAMSMEYWSPHPYSYQNSANTAIHTVWSPQLYSVVSAAIQCGLCSYTVWSRQLYSVVLAAIQCGFCSYTVWYPQLCNVVSTAIQCGICSYTVWSPQMYSVVSAAIQCGLRSYTVWSKL